MTLDHSIHIDAPPTVVWDVTEDVERWPEWQPTVTSVRRLDAGPFGLGSAALIKQPAQPEAVWTVTAFEPGRAFTWETRQPGLKFVGSHEVIADGAGAVSRLRIEASGLAACGLWPVLRFAIPWSLARENAGLKRRCEAIAFARMGPGFGPL